MPSKRLVADGDSLANIAYEQGFLPETIWNHADNQALREKRPDMNMLLPGDVLTIPDLEERTYRAPPASGTVFA